MPLSFCTCRKREIRAARLIAMMIEGKSVSFLECHLHIISHNFLKVLPFTFSKMESNGTDQKSRAGIKIENRAGIVTEEIAVIEGGIMIVGAGGIGTGTMTEIVDMTGKGTEIMIVLKVMTQDGTDDRARDRGIMTTTGTCLDSDFVICRRSNHSSIN